MGPGSLMRWARTVGFAVTCTVLAVLAHVWGGGRFDAQGALLGLLLVGAVSFPLTGRERTRGPILIGTAVAQIVLHLLLGCTDSTLAAPVDTSPMTGHADHVHGASPGLTMLMAHATAVLVTAAWLAHGEARLCALVRHLVLWAMRPLTSLLAALLALAGDRRPARIGPAASSADRRTPCARIVLRHAVVRRGPPGALRAPAT